MTASQDKPAKPDSGNQAPKPLMGSTTSQFTVEHPQGTHHQDLPSAPAAPQQIQLTIKPEDAPKPEPLPCGTTDQAKPDQQSSGQQGGSGGINTPIVVSGQTASGYPTKPEEKEKGED